MIFTGEAVRYLPGGRVEYVVDVRSATHEALEALVVAVETSLLAMLPPDDERYDNSGRNRP